ncbi:hypothetical protein B0H10DRAFT_2164011 [Mycena sp. CBHHK59/15]|nr:hypothetical protein B0H10DRAFT_2164011 [Mycena sp. CBHHK59/15]
MTHRTAILVKFHPAARRQGTNASVSTAHPPFVICGQKLTPTSVFNTLWQWLAERKGIDDRRRAGLPAPWTQDPILQKFKFCNAYRVLDRTSQFVVREVIEKGAQDRTEMLFRILLFNCFNKIETWQLLARAFGRGGAPTYTAFDLDAYGVVLDVAVAAGTTLFTSAYMKIGHRLDYDANHMRHLQLLQILMHDLPPVLASARFAADVYERIAAYPGMAAFTAYQLLLSLSYSPLLPFAANDFVVPGPGARSGLAKMFGRSIARARAAVPAADIEAEVLRWMARTQTAHFARLGLAFAPLRGADGRARPLDVADLEHAVCEVDKYARVRHPGVPGIGTRTQLRGRFTPTGALPASPVLPAAWADPARRTARVRKGPVVVEQRYCILRIVGERKAGSGGIEYQVTWLGYTERTWEPRALILEDAPEIVAKWVKAKKGGRR